MQKKKKTNNVFLINRKFLMIQHKKLYDSKNGGAWGATSKLTLKFKLA
ncbi:hypothetical protein E34_1039 [Lactococcus lactis subsp. lactis]|nr:hypothetical protein E34_1039 [Lactococcus lactis subsp. lactis]